MYDAIETIELIDDSKVHIVYDSNPSNPRTEWDNFCTIAGWHRRYNIGDVQPRESPEEYREGLPENAVVRTVYMLDHSGVVLALGEFADPWDSGPVGYIWAIPNEDAPTEEDVVRIMEAEIQTYSSYLNGEVYGYIHEDKHGDIIDSCYGFYSRTHIDAEVEDIKTVHENEIAEAIALAG